MPDPRLTGIVEDVAHRPPVDRTGRPRHGDRYGLGTVLRTQSRGPGIPLKVRNPLGRKPVRLAGYSTADRGLLDGARSDASTITISNIDTPEGQEVVFILE